MPLIDKVTSSMKVDITIESYISDKLFTCRSKYGLKFDVRRSVPIGCQWVLMSHFLGAAMFSGQQILGRCRQSVSRQTISSTAGGISGER
jgi:hypothetical protein